MSQTTLSLMTQDGNIPHSSTGLGTVHLGCICGQLVGQLEASLAQMASLMSDSMLVINTGATCVS